MMVNFYFDPSCPWSWVTSRWLTEVSQHRQIELIFIPFSLALKNGELNGGDVTRHAAKHRSSHQILRVIESVSLDHGRASTAKLYDVFGHAVHNQNSSILSTAPLIKTALTDCGYAKTYAISAEDAKFDASLQTYIDDAEAIAGNDIGVPLLIIDHEGGRKAFFGPVLGSLPALEAGLQLWDSLSGMVAIDDFYELKSKRLRPVNPKSTDRLYKSD